MRRVPGLIALAVAAGALALPAAASAGTLSWVDFTTDVKYVVPDSSFNNNQVSLAGSSGKLVLTDAHETVTVSNAPGAPAEKKCTSLMTSLPSKAECTGVAAGDSPYDILITLGGMGDELAQNTDGFSVLASGESGPDVLHGGTAADLMIGGTEDDKLYGSGGADKFADGVVLYGFFGGSPEGDGNDQWYGEAGNDMLAGEQIPGGGVGRDLMDGGPDVDTADYGERTAPVNLSLNAIADDGQANEQDNLVNVENANGGSAADVIGGSDLANTLHGNAGNDMIAGGAGPDKLYGDNDDDTLAGGPGGDLYDGGPGRDSVSYADVPGPVTVNFGATPNSGQAGEGDSFAPTVEVITGSPAGDTFTGDGNPNEFHTGAGNDNMDGGEGADTLDASDGADTIVGGGGDDTIDAGVGTDAVEASPGDDKINVRDGEKDSVTCGTGNDTVDADQQDDVFSDCETVNRADATPDDMTPDGPGGGGGGSGGGGGGGSGGGGGMAALLRAAIAPAKVKVDKRGRGTLMVGCPAAASASCNAGVALATKAKKPLKLSKVSFKAAPGATKKVRFKLSKKGRARLRKRKSMKAVVTVAPKKGAVAPARTTRTVKLVLKRR